MRVRGIEAVAAIVNGILRHLRLFIACSPKAEELFRMDGWRYSQGVEEKRGIAKEKLESVNTDYYG